MISRAKIRRKKLDEDCKRACTSTNEFGPDDDRVFCYGLVDCSTDELIEKCKSCKALAYNATPLEQRSMNKYEEALDWLTWRCMEPNNDYEGLVYDQVPDFEIEANIEPLRKLIEKTKPKYVVAKIRFRKNAPQIEAYLCPSCGAHVSKNQKYCQNCMQSIDWEKAFWRWGNQFTVYEDYLKEGEQEEN